MGQSKESMMAAQWVAYSVVQTADQMADEKALTMADMMVGKMVDLKAASKETH